MMTLAMKTEALQMCVRACSGLYDSPLSLVRLSHATNLEVFRASDVCVTVFSWQGYTVVACQGSNSVQDWLKYNLRLSMVHGIHSGFDRAAKAVSSRIIQSISRRSNPVILCGHSLGGAIAQRLTTLLPDYDSVAGVFTFGSPRVYSKDLAYEYDLLFGDRTLRVVFKHDFITTIPWAMGAYQHAGPEVILNGDASFGKRTTAWFLTAALRVVPKLVGLVTFDHNMGQYESAVSADAENIASQTAS